MFVQEVYVQRRKRGVVGWFFLVVFLIWNAIMALTTWAAFQGIQGVPAPKSGAEAAGAAIGTAVVGTVILWVWLFGSLITGLLALLTRGSKTVTIRKIRN